MANKSSNKPLAAIYGQALYEAAFESGQMEHISGELAALNAMLRKDPKLGEFFESPTISFENKRKVIDGVFKAQTAVTRNFLLVIAERGRASMFGQIVGAYNEYALHKANVASVEVRSARELSNDERVKLVAMLEQKLSKKISLNERVNPALIGGMVVVHEDKMWDGSLSHKLNEAIKRMEEAKTSAVKWND